MLNNNYLDIVDMIDNVKKNSAVNSTTSKKSKLNSKNDLFNNVLKSSKNNKKILTKYKSKTDNYHINYTRNDKESGNIEQYNKFLKLNTSNYVDDSVKDTKKILFLDDDNTIELNSELLNNLNELLEVLLNLTNFNIEDFNVKGINDNQEINLANFFSELTNYTYSNLNNISNDQLMKIKELSLELVDSLETTDNEELIETIEKLLSLMNDKDIIEKGSELDALNTNNLDTFIELNNDTHNTTRESNLINQDKVLEEIIYEADYSGKINDKEGNNIENNVENNIENNIDDEKSKYFDEFKLLNNTLNNNVENVSEGNNFDDKLGKFNFNQYESNARDVENLLREVAQKTKFILKENGSEVHIQLKPEILGKMILKMSLEKGEMHAKAVVDNMQAKQLIDNNLIQLKETLRDQGIEVKTFEVFVGKDPNFSNRQRNYWSGKSKLKLKKASIDEYEDINTYYVNMFDNNSNTVLVHTTNFDIKA